MPETIAADTDELRPICFMIMPYGKKPSLSDRGPAIINYDVLWDKLLEPLIEEDLGYQAIRADQDLGALIIKEMIERLAYADLVIAEVSTPNPNVYYEIGIRHAAKETGCVLISADWSRQNFDLDQIRQIRYTLNEEAIGDSDAASARAILKDAVQRMINGRSPVFDSVPGFPARTDAASLSSFREQIADLSRFATELKQIRLLEAEQRHTTTAALARKYKRAIQTIPAVSMELLYLMRDNTDWELMLAFTEQLPEMMQQQVIVKEQRCLALSKTGKHIEAIAGLEELIAQAGDTAERRALIGGRYKKLFTDTGDNAYLNKAISAYEQAMMLDLNNYHPGSNLPRLYRRRNRRGDEEKAKTTAIVTTMACERSRKLNPADEWALPTLLGMAFDAGDLTAAGKLLDEMSGQNLQPFKLETTLPDLELSASLHQDPAIKDGLGQLLEEMKQLM